MINRQKDAATTHAKSTLKLISVSAVALLIGIGAAAAQGGSSRQTEHNVEKQKDKELLTPVRPLPRKVGDTSWPEAKPEAQREANERKAAPVRETTGQSLSAQSDKAQQPQPSQNTAQNPPASNNAQQPAQSNTQQAKSNSQPDHASIRLGTDASGKVAINDDQEQQLAKALRKAKPVEVNVGVQIGNAPPQEVRLTAVSADMAQVLPQFLGYAYFATAEQVYIVDVGANRVVAMVPVKLTATVKRDAPSRTTVSNTPAAPAQPEANAATAKREEAPSRATVSNAPAAPAQPETNAATVKREEASSRTTVSNAPAPAAPPEAKAATVKREEAPSRATVSNTPAAPAQPEANAATVKREEAPPRTTVSSAPAATAPPEAKAAPAHTATVTTTPAHTATVTTNPAHSAPVTTTPPHTTKAATASEPRSKRSTRRGDDMAGIEAAIEREVRRKGLEARGSVVVVEEAPAIQRVPTRRWRPWFAGDVQ